MVEYGLMLALIAVVAMGTVGVLGGSLDGMFGNVNTAVSGS
jgi:Flp pilus assembly pilin Flp